MDSESEIQSQNMTVDQAVSVLVRDLPKPVQDFVTGPERGKITIALSQKYGLHVDTAGAFERAFIFMLLGISTPGEFVKSLQEAGVPQETVQGLANDVNTEVFMKLRHAEQENPGGILPVQLPAQQTPPPVPATIPSSVPTAPQRQPLTAPIASQMSQPTRPGEQHDVRTMASDIALVKSGAFQERHEAALSPMPHMNMTPPPVRPPDPIPTAPRQVVPAPPAVPQVPAAPVTPRVTPPMRPAPAAPIQAAPQSYPVTPKAPAPQSENRDALHQILKQYGVDPYREPAE